MSLSPTGISPSAPSAVTISIASPCVITWTNHNLLPGSVIFLNTTGALPTGLSVLTPYFVIAAGFTTGSFEVAATIGGAAINTSGSQSGTQTAVAVAQLLTSGQNVMANSVSVAIASDQTPSVTSLVSGAITNPSSTLTRPSSAVTASVTATDASPCVFTWTSNPLVNGQTVILGGTTAPTGFTAGIVYYVVGVSGNNFNLAATLGGAAINSTSTGTAVTATLTYAAAELIGSATASGSVVVPSFAIQTTSGGAIISRLRLVTNATSGWGNVQLSINLWTAPPTYTNGDGGAYAATGASNWLGNFLVSLIQFVDGAAGGGVLAGANEMALKLASGTTIYWDPQILTTAMPIVSQTFTLVPELLN
jgi:hypothetical protein